MKEQGIKTKKN